MRYFDFCRIFAEAKLTGDTGPQKLNNSVYKGGLSAIAPYYEDVYNT
jgi:hypothetical protein